MTFEKIKDRQIIRAQIAEGPNVEKGYNALLLISESIDDYIEHRIETDKVLEGILKDIQGNQVRMERFAHRIIIEQQRLKS